MAKVALKVKPSDSIRKMLNEPADVELLQAWPDIMAEVAAGAAAPTINELLTRKLIKFATNPNRPHQWAVQILIERAEGKAVQGEPADDGGRVIEERWDDLQKRHLDDLAAQFVEAGRSYAGPASSQPADGAARQTSKLMDLPSNRAYRPKEAGGQLPVADGPAKEGGG